MSVRIAGPPGVPAAARLDVPRLRRAAQSMLGALGRSRAELSLALVDDDAIRQLNGEFRGNPRPTDVLSFSLLEGEHPEHRGSLLGDVVVSIDTAAAQARERRRSLDEVVTRLVIHGVLHLVGHDHEDEAEARVMRGEERRLWRAVRNARPSVRTIEA